MKPEVRAAFQAKVRDERSRGASITEAIAKAYAWLLKPSPRVKVLKP